MPIFQGMGVREPEIYLFLLQVLSAGSPQTLVVCFFLMSHLLAVSPFSVPLIILYYLFPVPLCVLIPIPCLLKTSLTAQKLVFELKQRLRKLSKPEAALRHTLAHL